MTIYRVKFNVVTDYIVDIEADNEDDAESLAKYLHDARGLTPIDAQLDDIYVRENKLPEYQGHPDYSVAQEDADNPGWRN